MNLPATQTTMTRAWLTVGLLWAVGVLNNLDRIMLTTMRESIKTAIPMTEAQFGLLTSLFLWCYALLNPFAGFLADRFNRSRVIITGLFVWSLMTWLTGQARSYEQLLAARMFMGISEACFLPAALALIADYHGRSTRSLASGIVIAGLGVGSALGGLGGWLAERQGWTYAFTLFGIGGMVYAMMLIMTLRDAPRTMRDKTTLDKTRPDLGEALTSLLGNGSFRLILLCWGIIGIAGWAVIGWMPTYLSERFDLSQSAAGIMATRLTAQIAGLLGLLIGGAWADRWSLTNKRARIHVAVIGLCSAALGIFICAQAGVLAVALGGLIFYGLMRVFLDANMMPILCTACDARYRATGFGIMNLLSCLLGGMSLYAGGALRDAQLDVNKMFFLGAVILVICAVAVHLVKPQQAVISEAA